MFSVHQGHGVLGIDQYAHYAVGSITEDEHDS